MSSICTFVFSAFGYKISAVKYRILVRFCQVLLALFLFLLRQFFPHALNQFTQKLPIIHIINQNHFFRTIIWRFHLSIRHQFHRHRNRLYQKSVIIYSAKKPSSIIKDVFSHSLYWMPDNSLQFLRHCLPFIAQINTRLAKTCNIRFIILQNTSNLSASLGIIVFSFCNKIVIVSSNYLFS